MSPLQLTEINVSAAVKDTAVVCFLIFFKRSNILKTLQTSFSEKSIPFNSMKFKDKP